MAANQIRTGLLFFIIAFIAACAPVQTPLKSFATATSSATAQLPNPQAVELGILGKGSARDMAWSPDGSLLAVTSSIGVYLYDTQTWQVVKTIHKNIFGDKSFGAVTFSLDQKSLIMRVTDYTTSSFWHYDLKTDQAVPWLEILTINPQAIPLFSPDGKTFAFLNRVCKKNGK